jgi:hypothetical protein
MRFPVIHAAAEAKFLLKRFFVLPKSILSGLSLPPELLDMMLDDVLL